MSRQSEMSSVSAHVFGSNPKLAAIGRTPQKCRNEATALRAKIADIFAAAEKENRELTDEEKTEVESMCGSVARLNREEKILDAWAISDATNAGAAAPSHATEWRDSDGRPVYLLRPQDRWSDLPRRADIDPSASIGQLIKCAITGSWRTASPTIRNVQAEGTDSTGGFLVPDELMRSVIDSARARSFVMQAGAATVPMATETLRLARVSTDPTFEVKAENSAFTGSTISFDSLNFTSKLVGTLITCSRELAEDAPNFVEMIEQVLAASFATALDNIAVNGVTSTSLDGILDWTTASGIGETGSVGAILWEDLQTAVVGVQGQNFEPNAYCVHPTIAGDLAALTSGDGANSAKLWLGAPPNVAPLRQFVTTNIANDSIIVGDWSQFVWAIRQSARIEVSREAGDAFSKHQVLVKLTWRGDTGAFRRTAFHRLVGITT